MPEELDDLDARHTAWKAAEAEVERAGMAEIPSNDPEANERMMREYRAAQHARDMAKARLDAGLRWFWPAVSAEVRAARRLRAELAPLVEACGVAAKRVAAASDEPTAYINSEAYSARDDAFRIALVERLRLADAYIAATTARAGDGEEGSK